MLEAALEEGDGENGGNGNSGSLGSPDGAGAGNVDAIEDDDGNEEERPLLL